MNQWTTIRTLHARGYGKKAIARMLGISRNTVKRALASCEAPRYERRPMPTKIMPFRDQIEQMYWEKDLIGTRIFQELKKLGYAGSLTTLYRYLRKLGPKKLAKVTCRFETGPGEQGQFDWTPYEVTIADQTTTVYCFLFVLGYSRMKYLTFSLNQTLSSCLEALEEAFWYLGGAPKEVLVDNAKQLVVEHPQKGEALLNQKFEELAGLYCFVPRACHLYRARTKGKVERPFYVVEQHFIKGNTFSSFADLLEKAKAFNEEWNRKVNATTLKEPLALFEEEKLHLLPLVSRCYRETLREMRKVSWDCLVSFGGSRYSVPHPLAGKQVWVRVKKGSWLEILSPSGEVIATHEISRTKGKTVINEEHYQGLKPQAPKTALRVRETLAKVFQSGEAFYQGLAARTGSNAAYHARQILALRDYYCDQDIERALAKALAFKAFHHQSVLSILRSFPLREVEFSPQAAPEKLGRENPTRPLDYYATLLEGGEGLWP